MWTHKQFCFLRAAFFSLFVPGRQSVERPPISQLSMPPMRDVPAAGWCKTQHRPLKPAHSGYDGYCKACFRDLFPDKYFAKQQKRNHACRMCGGVGEVLRGLCRPCVRLRTCATCAAVNEKEEPQRCLECKQCPSLWCRECTSFDDRANGVVFRLLVEVRQCSMLNMQSCSGAASGGFQMCEY